MRGPNRTGGTRPLIRTNRLAVAALLVLASLLGACKGKESAEPEAFSFVVYPGARYLGHLTEKTKEAHRTLINPGQEPPPTAMYDTDASVEQVAQFYAEKYGYETVVESATSLTTTKGNAYYLSGDLAADAAALAPILEKLGLPSQIQGAQGQYRGARIAPKANRPTVTIQRPYIDVVNSNVVDRTLIHMTK